MLEDLHGIVDGRLRRGYDLYRALARVNPVLWPAVAVLELGAVTRVGPLLYGAVARRRRRMLGTCELGGAPPPLAAVPARPQSIRLGGGAATVLASIAFLFAVTSTDDRLKEEIPQLHLPYSDAAWIVEASARMGLVVPDVFNAGDLRTSEQWWTGRRVARRAATTSCRSTARTARVVGTTRATPSTSGTACLGGGA